MQGRFSSTSVDAAHLEGRYALMKDVTHSRDADVHDAANTLACGPTARLRAR
jgi:hypothetical protein